MNIRYSKMLNQISFYCLFLLVVFLPFSSWLVSLTGNIYISSLRDFLAAIILLCGIFYWLKLKKGTVFWLIALLIIWGLLSYFWHQASALQWLKGVRFTFAPFVLMLGLISSQFDQKQRKILLYAALSAGLIIIILAFLDFLGVSLPLTSSLSGSGGLESSHFVGTLAVRRVQAVMAGPNALGLYLLTVFAGVVAYTPKKIWLWILAAITALLIILTFSRSCLIGLAVMAILFVWQSLADRLGKLKSLLLMLTAVFLLALAGFITYRAGIGQQYFTHNVSSSLRSEQYQRIWQQRDEIGLLGRGSGTAGPSSQNRVDGGPNHWTENTYLDIYEELGLVGFILFVALLLAMAWHLAKANGFWSHSAYFALWAYLVSGIFLNFYTGQAGLWSLVILASLALQPSFSKGKNE